MLVCESFREEMNILPDDTKKLKAMHISRKKDFERNDAFLAVLDGNTRTARTQKLLPIRPLVLHRKLSDRSRRGVERDRVARAGEEEKEPILGSGIRGSE